MSWFKKRPMADLSCASLILAIRRLIDEAGGDKEVADLTYKNAVIFVEMFYQSSCHEYLQVRARWRPIVTPEILTVDDEMLQKIYFSAAGHCAIGSGLRLSMRQRWGNVYDHASFEKAVMEETMTFLKEFDKVVAKMTRATSEGHECNMKLLA